MFFDGFDGRVARLTRTQSQFGVELDSLADVISFGVAPAMLVYKWALAPLGFIGLFAAFLYTACGALRLARFNVLSQRAASHRFFVGLPIPLAAGTIVSVVIAHHLTRGRELGTGARVPYLVVVTVLSLLMVSTLRYRTFKDLRLNAASLSIFGAVCISGVLIATRLHPAYVLVTYFCAYLALGFVESGLWLGRHLHARGAQPAVGVLEDETADADEAEDEQDFL
jgi:CDP-diacylglycerol--serine O-phosphatidyltransferase